MQIRNKIAANQVAAAVDQVFTTLNRNGYNPDHPKKVAIATLKTVEEVHEMGQDMRNGTNELDEDGLQIMNLLSE